MTSRFVAASAAVLALVGLTALVAACGDSVGTYCDYTDCSAGGDGGVDGAVVVADAGSDAS